MSSPVFGGYWQTHGLFWLLDFVEELLMNMLLHLIPGCLCLRNKDWWAIPRGHVSIKKKPKPQTQTNYSLKVFVFSFLCDKISMEGFLCVASEKTFPPCISSMWPCRFLSYWQQVASLGMFRCYYVLTLVSVFSSPLHIISSVEWEQATLYASDFTSGQYLFCVQWPVDCIESLLSCKLLENTLLVLLRPSVFPTCGFSLLCIVVLYSITWTSLLSPGEQPADILHSLSGSVGMLHVFLSSFSLPGG